MEARIASHMSAEILLVCNSKKWVTVAIINSGETLSEPIRENSQDILVLQFDDVEYSLDGYVMPSEEDIEKALHFTADRKMVMFTCHAGISRSSALAYVCKCQSCPAAEAIMILTPIKHYPNKRIVELGANLLGNDLIYKTYLKWIQSDRMKF